MKLLAARTDNVQASSFSQEGDPGSWYFTYKRLMPLVEGDVAGEVRVATSH